MGTPELQEFLAALHGYDPVSVQRQLDEVGPILRHIIHMRLVDGRLHHIADTTDIFQSLLKDFLRRKGRDLPSAHGSAGLLAYLCKAVRNKILRRLQKERRHAGSLPEGWDPSADERTVDRHDARAELAEAIRHQLPPLERRLLDLRVLGLTWPEIAGKVDGDPDALRIRLGRAIAKVLDELNHEE